MRRLREWWRMPVTPRERRWALLIGAVGGFWIGALARMVLGPLPVGLQAIGTWALAAAALGVACGWRFPKATLCVCLPFALLGGGD